MLDKEKLFIVIYVNITGFGDANKVLNSIAEITKFDESVMRIIVPVCEGETRVECINPVLLSEEQYEETRNRIESLTEKLEKVIKEINKDYE